MAGFCDFVQLCACSLALAARLARPLHLFSIVSLSLYGAISRARLPRALNISRDCGARIHGGAAYHLMLNQKILFR
mgnify:CR=1 FL=1